MRAQPYLFSPSPRVYASYTSDSTWHGPYPGENECVAIPWARELVRSCGFSSLKGLNIALPLAEPLMRYRELLGWRIVDVVLGVKTDRNGIIWKRLHIINVFCVYVFLSICFTSLEQQLGGSKNETKKRETIGTGTSWARWKIPQITSS